MSAVIEVENLTKSYGSKRGFAFPGIRYWPPTCGRTTRVRKGLASCFWVQ